MSRAVMRPGRCKHAGVEPDLTYHGKLGPYKAWGTSWGHVIDREYKTARGGHRGHLSSWPLVRDTPRVRRPCRPVVSKARNVERRMRWNQSINQSINLYLNTVRSIRNLKIKKLKIT